MLSKKYGTSHGLAQQRTTRHANRQSNAVRELVERTARDRSVRPVDSRSEYGLSESEQQLVRWRACGISVQSIAAYCDANSFDVARRLDEIATQSRRAPVQWSSRTELDWKPVQASQAGVARIVRACGHWRDWPTCSRCHFSFDAESNVRGRRYFSCRKCHAIAIVRESKRFLHVWTNRTIDASAKAALARRMLKEAA